jgi:two-component system, chemotaxis family, chemotaxis protein CheY
MTDPKSSPSKAPVRGILVVEDDPDLLKALTMSFKAKFSCPIVTASDGWEAFRKASKQTFDLMCTDFQMPKLTGGLLINALREQRINSKTPIIVATGYTQEAQLECQSLGQTQDIAFLEKPIDKKSLLILAAKMLNVDSGSAVQEKGKPAAPLQFDFSSALIRAIYFLTKDICGFSEVKHNPPRTLSRVSRVSGDISFSVPMSVNRIHMNLIFCMDKELFVEISKGISGWDDTDLQGESRYIGRDFMLMVYTHMKRELGQSGATIETSVPVIIDGLKHGITGDGSHPGLHYTFSTSKGVLHAVVTLSNFNSQKMGLPEIPADTKGK